MENNNLDLIRDENSHDDDQNTTYAEEIDEAVTDEVTEELDEEITEEIDEAVADEVTEELDEEITEEIDDAVADDVTEELDEEVSGEADEETDEEKKPCRRAVAVLSSIYDLAEIFALSIIAVIVIFSFCVRLCVVDGHSMETTLSHGERIIAQDLFYTPKQGDIVVFHLVNDTFKRPLVKRVIATEGQTVEIDYDAKTIFVDGVRYPDDHAYFEGDTFDIRTDLDPKYTYSYGGKTFFRATVPEGMIFVLGDNRNNSTDSRSVHIGFVDVDCVLGKAILRLDPFTIFD